ncbi:hypothetical protein BAQU_0461 [Bifidobacterium aquikefiri]|uniref:Uncharacterized protein n=1 Tax=Bifidobacterium aquikefiri TaxID=1653207 RepID=A0A261G8Q9_9BIFI|nr:hypothetical protein BAQU_0461 [Bifidobacterium aquikefiri]
MTVGIRASLEMMVRGMPSPSWLRQHYIGAILFTGCALQVGFRMILPNSDSPSTTFATCTGEDGTNTK